MEKLNDAILGERGYYAVLLDEKNLKSVCDLISQDFKIDII